MLGFRIKAWVIVLSFADRSTRTYIKGTSRAHIAIACSKRLPNHTHVRVRILSQPQTARGPCKTRAKAWPPKAHIQRGGTVTHTHHRAALPANARCPCKAHTLALTLQKHTYRGAVLPRWQGQPQQGSLQRWRSARRGGCDSGRSSTHRQSYICARARRRRKKSSDRLGVGFSVGSACPLGHDLKEGEEELRDVSVKMPNHIVVH